MILPIILIVLSLIFSAFFAGLTEVFITSNKLDIELLKNKDSKNGRILSELYNNPGKFMNSMLSGSQMALVTYTLLFSAVLTPLFYKLLPHWPILITVFVVIVLTLIMVIVGLHLPSAIMGAYGSDILTKLAPTLNFLIKLLAFPSWFVTKSTNVFTRLFLGKVEIKEDHLITKLDLEDYIQSNVAEDTDIDKEILSNALHLNQIKARDCMIPRNEIVFVDKSDDIQAILDVFISSKLSRLIVVDGDIENVIGYIHHQQLFKKVSSLKRNIMPIDFVPDVMNLQDLMYQFIKNRNNIACVVNEFGSTAGIITLEDILEEIFGEIEDEHDDENYVEKIISDREFIFSGRLELSYLNSKYEQLDFPDEDYITLSGYIVMTSGTIPSVGSIIELDDYKFIVLARSKTKIEEVRVIVNQPEKNQERESK